VDVALLILGALLSIAIVIALWRGGWQTLLSGFKQAGNNFKSLWLRLLLGITLGGFLQVLIPSASVAEWLGPASGLKGILTGTFIGALVMGGPYVRLPIIAAIYDAGAGVGPVIAFLTAGMLGPQGLITRQIPFLGARLALTRYIVCLLVPPIVGLAGSAVYQLLGLD
jgi:uncharacterized membrane protein YraQ (UPF0718 family)